MCVINSYDHPKGMLIHPQRAHVYSACFTTVASVLFGHQIPIEVLLLPVAALFAFPQLRSTLPGIPDGV
jgi:hypothetical protein